MALAFELLLTILFVKTEAKLYIPTGTFFEDLKSTLIG